MAQPLGHHRDDEQDRRHSGVRGGRPRADDEQRPDNRGKRLLVRSAPIPDPGAEFLGQIPVPAAFAWVRQTAGLAGWGEAARVTLPAGADRFTTAEKWLREVADGADIEDAVGRRGSGLVAFGAFTFDDASDGSVPAMPG